MIQYSMDKGSNEQSFRNGIEYFKNSVSFVEF